MLCVSPELTRTGRVPFDLHISGQNSSFTGIAIYISGKPHKAHTQAHAHNIYTRGL